MAPKVWSPCPEVLEQITVPLLPTYPGFISTEIKTRGDVADPDFIAICRQIFPHFRSRNTCSEMWGRLFSQVYRNKLLVKWVSVLFTLLQWMFKNFPKWEYMWSMHMDGSNGYVDAHSYLLQPLVWCWIHISSEGRKKKRMGNSISHIHSANGSFQIILLW